jgi:hypothetical protein
MGKTRSAAAPRRFSVLHSAGLSAGGTCSLKEFLNTGRPLLRRFVHTSTVFQKCQHPKPFFFARPNLQTRRISWFFVRNVNILQRSFLFFG